MTLWVWGHSYLPTRSSAPLDPRKYLPGEGPSARPSSRLHCQHSGQGSGRICGVFDSCHTQVWAARVGVAGPLGASGGVPAPRATGQWPGGKASVASTGWEILAVGPLLSALGP